MLNHRGLFADPLAMRIVTTLFAICLVIVAAPAAAESSTGYHGRREVVKAMQGVVATDDGRCSAVGRDVLHDGGNAIDATVAAALCLGVVSPASSGIGGGAFMLVRLANGKSQAFDFRETAPLHASKNMYADNPSAKASGVLSIAVPSEVAGLYEAWKQHGILPWKRLVRPAILLASKGFRISPYLHMQMVKTETGILKDKGLSKIFSTKDGKLMNIGHLCRNEKLAQTLKAVARFGPRAIYNGSVGLNLVQDVQESGGILTMKDLSTYQVKVKEPIHGELLDYEIIGMPPPSAGGVGLMLILNILSRYEIPHGLEGSVGLHREIEALKHMAALRMNLGDPDFSDVSDVVSDMLSPEFAERLKATIFDNMTFNSSYYGGKWNLINDHGTSHMSIVDRNRNAVSITSTINYYFGSVFMSPRTGIILNNEMDDFSIPNSSSTTSLPPAPANFIKPSKRPLSSMAPTIILKDGQLKAVVGASGGAMIIAATMEVILNHIFKGMDPFSSVMAPRSYHQLVPNLVMYENWTTVSGDHFEVPDELRKGLLKRGHVLEGLAGGTICQFVVHELDQGRGHNKYGILHGELTAISDPRKGGFPAGF